MCEVRVEYFEKPGSVNTDRTVEIAKGRGEGLGIKALGLNVGGLHSSCLDIK